MKNKITKEQLYDMYIIRDMSISDIQKETKLGKTTILRLLKKYEIKARGFGGHKNQIVAAYNRRGKYISPKKGTGKRFVIKDGYRWLLLPEHPMANKKVM